MKKLILSFVVVMLSLSAFDSVYAKDAAECVSDGGQWDRGSCKRVEGSAGGDSYNIQSLVGGAVGDAGKASGKTGKFERFRK